jgi:hypothetical protein
MTGEGTDGDTVTGESTTIQWDPRSRVASVRYAEDANLTAAAGVFIVEALTRWVGVDRQPFGVLADGSGLRGTDSEYRAKASAFFRQHRDTSYIALFHLGPVIHVVVEMFRVGTAIQLRSFGDEAAARAWLRTKGIAA